MLIIIITGFVMFMSGPGVPCGCQFSDIDKDQDVDLRDFAQFQNNFGCTEVYGCGYIDPDFFEVE